MTTTVPSYQPRYLRGLRFSGTAEQKTEYAWQASQELLNHRIKLLATTVLATFGLILATGGAGFLFYAALSSPQCAVVSGCVGPAIACGLIGGYIAAPLLVFWMSLYDDYFSDRAIQEIDRAVETFHPQNLSRFSPLNNIQALRKREILDEATASHMHRLTLFYGQKEFEAEWEAWEQLKGRLSQNMRPPDTIQPS